MRRSTLFSIATLVVTLVPATVVAASQGPTRTDSIPKRGSTAGTPDHATAQDTTPPKDTLTDTTKVVLDSSAECAHPKSEWLFCDDFESDRLAKYFEYRNPHESFTRVKGVGLNASWGMRAHFDSGQVDAGSLKLAFGKTPDPYIRSVDSNTVVHRELYWRVYLRNDSSWSGGGGDKLSRAQSLATTSWAQAMVAPVWSGSGDASRYLFIDPATGTDPAGNLLETTYNDFPHQHYLGYRAGTLPLFDAAHVGRWYCVEAHARLNDAGQSNGVFELWIDDQPQASRNDLNWLGSFSAYGLNAVFFENYWNAGSPKAQTRYLDNIVVSTARIGCDASHP